MENESPYSSVEAKELCELLDKKLVVEIRDDAGIHWV